MGGPPLEENIGTIGAIIWSTIEGMAIVLLVAGAMLISGCNPAASEQDYEEQVIQENGGQSEVYIEARDHGHNFCTVYVDDVVVDDNVWCESAESEYGVESH